MAGLFEINQVAKREDLMDILTRVDEKATPFVSMVSRGSTPKNTYMEWPVDAYADPNVGTGVIDGTDVSTYENAAEQRALLSSYLQTFRRTAKVSRLAQSVSDVAGVSDEISNAISVKGVELLRDMESAMLSDQEHQVDTGSVAYLLRGLGVWLRDTTNLTAAGAGSVAGQSLHQVPAAFRSSVEGTATASLTETILQTLLQTLWTNTGMRGDYKLFCDATLRRRFTDFTRTIATAGYSGRDFNFKGDSTKVSNTTTIFDGDFGTVEVIADNFIGYSSTGAAQEAGRGYLVDMNKVDIRMHKNPTVERFEDQGGGERFMIEARASLCVRNPLGMAQFSPALT
jgi:hypothetical protein